MENFKKAAPFGSRSVLPADEAGSRLNTASESARLPQEEAKLSTFHPDLSHYH